MKKKLTEKTVYEPNDRIKVTVQNKPIDNDGLIQYERKVTVTVNAGFDKQKLTFATDDDIKEFVENIDFEDPQQSMEM